MYIHLVKSEETNKFLEEVKKADPFLRIKEYNTFIVFESDTLAGWVNLEVNKKLTVYPKNDTDNMISLSIDNIDSIYTL